MIKKVSIVCVLFLLLPVQILHAESVFLKNGSIVEGRIESESRERITVVSPDKSRRVIQREDVIRILYYFDYKNRYLITDKNGTVLDVYMVEETVNSYKYREELYWPDEELIQKGNVRSIVKDASGDPKKVSSYDDFLRAGIGTGAGRGNDNLEKRGAVRGVFFDVIPCRTRFTGGRMIELFFRGERTMSGIRNSSSLGYSDIDGYTLLKSSEIEQLSAGAGGRFSYGKYYAGFMWQLYGLAYIRYSRVNVRLDYSDTETRTVPGTMKYRYNSFGAVGGIGFEVAFFRHLGIFAEYSCGFSPSFESKKNSEINMLRTGVSLRI